MSLVELKVHTDEDPTGAQLREVLAAIRKVERLSSVRLFLCEALALLGVLLWVAVVWPGSVASPLRDWLLFGYLLLALGTAVALGYELRGRRIRDRLLVARGARKV